MKIAVCIKRVPDTTTRIKIAPDGKSVDPNVEYIISPYDEYAIEEAIRIKERLGGEVTLFTLGPEGAKEIIRKTLALGADNAVHLKAEIPGIYDSLAVSKALASHLKEAGFDLILFGKQGIDGDNMLTGTMVAQLLGMPSISVVVKLDVRGTKVICQREVEGALEVVETTLPCVITAQKGLNEPRYASLKGIMEAKKKAIQEVSVSLDSQKLEIMKMELPPERVGGKFMGKGKKDVPKLVELLKSEAKVL